MTEAVSVVIAAYNRERLLAAAIESALSQSPSPHEVIVVDDGSSDRTVDVARSFGPPVRCITQSHAGTSAARNAGVAASTGGYVALLDSDDVWTAGALGALIKPLRSDPSVDLVFGQVREFLTPDADADQPARVVAHEGLLPGFLVGATLARRDAFEKVGGFREDLVTAEFMDWIARARDLGLREAVIPDHVLWRRVHGENHGIRRKDSRGDYARVIKSALDRRRAALRRSDVGPH